MTSKHPAAGDTPADLQDDLDRNPGIGSSKGLFAQTSARDAELIEGDTDNDGGVAGGVNPTPGRTNK